MEFAVIDADFNQDEHQANISELLHLFAQEAGAIGSDRGLSPHIRSKIVPGLQSHPNSFVLLAIADTTPIGIAVCCRVFSTFSAKSVTHVQDLFVVPAWRERGVAHSLLQAIETKARTHHCARLTLEVIETNSTARSLYSKMGFSSPAAEKQVLFLTKEL